MEHYKKIILVLLICKFSLVFSQFCPDGWSLNGPKCYKVISTNASGINWNDAQKSCEGMGSNLVSIHNMNEQNFVVNLVNSNTFAPYLYGLWIGLIRTAPHSSTWRWTDGTPVDFNNWASNEGQPDDSTWNSTDGEQCAILWGTTLDSIRFLWNDLTCALDTFSFNGTGPLQVMGGYICKKSK